MSRALQELETIKREIEDPYYCVPSIAYNWNEGLAIIEKELKYAEAVNDHLFKFYYCAIEEYRKAKKMYQVAFGESCIELIIKIYARINNLSDEEAKRELADRLTALINRKK